MPYTAAQIRAVRLLVPDTEPVYGVAEDEYIFEDEDVEIYLDLGRGNPQWAAGLACMAIGGSEALLLKVVRNYETESDGSKLLKEWTAKGKLLIEIGKAEVDADTEDGFFDVVFPEWDMIRHPEGYTHPGYRDTPGGYQW